ncbi:MAG: F0F1 ATP synthase subunit C [Methylobacteriaceae bacterium]|jgi:F-type H+-transporting ATPase subunit c|nr:F0F1 ATP synthase subunit C [Methylobacteriaceae bacterium]
MEGLNYIGAGLACFGVGIAALGVGNIFGNFVSGALRNPGAAKDQFTNAIIGAALAEGLGLFAFVVAMILAFM